MMRRTSIWIMVFFIFVLSIVCGYFIAKTIKLNKIISSKNEIIESEISEERIRELEAAKVVNSEEEKIGVNTKVILKTTYGLCGHQEEKIEDQANVINMSKEELANAYRGWNIAEFSEDEVILEKENAGICGEHYVISEEDGLVIVYRKKVDKETGKILEEAVRTTDISLYHLPEEDLANIRSGEEIIGKENLNKFLEDYE